MEAGETGGMGPPPDPHYRHRFPAEIIGHAVWLYHVFSLSLRDVELLLAERGAVVSYETVRRWCKKFAASFADRLRRRRPRPGDKWHMDEVLIRIQGMQNYLWRAVDRKCPPDAPVYLVDVRLCGEPLVEPGADALNVPWQKLCDAIDWMIGDALDHMPQIGLGIEAVRLCGFDQAIDPCCT